MSNTRQPGYYWVKGNKGFECDWWYIGYWRHLADPRGQAWDIPGKVVLDDYFDEINETRIPSPNEPIYVNPKELEQLWGNGCKRGRR